MISYKHERKYLLQFYRSTISLNLNVKTLKNHVVVCFFELVGKIVTTKYIFRAFVVVHQIYISHFLVNCCEGCTNDVEKHY